MWPRLGEIFLLSSKLPDLVHLLILVTSSPSVFAFYLHINKGRSCVNNPVAFILTTSKTVVHLISFSNSFLLISSRTHGVITIFLLTNKVQSLPTSSLRSSSQFLSLVLSFLTHLFIYLFKNLFIQQICIVSTICQTWVGIGELISVL